MESPFKTSDIQRIEVSQYMTTAGLVILLWDHILTLSDEVQLIWRAKLSSAKVLFLLNRYLVPFAMIVQSHEFSGTATYLSLPVSTFPCKAWYALGVSVGMLSIATTNFLILLRLWVLWDRRPRLVLGTLIIFIVTQLVTLSFAGYVIYDMLPTLYFDSVMRVCTPRSKPKFAMLWTPGIVFELTIFFTTIWNALDRPRSRNIGMAKVLYRDGSLYFFGLFGLRLVNMLLCAFAPVSLTFLGVFFIWSISNITLARLILNLRRLPSETSCKKVGDEDMEDDVEDSAEPTELPVLRSESESQEPSYKEMA